MHLVFHEVRVPLNTALLSVQNLEADNVFRNLPPEQEECVLGLSSSLALMEKVARLLLACLMQS
jgi:osomolarity two-component system sensor histidine kinase SLN1